MPWRTALIGFGQIGETYSQDGRMASHYKYATHAQVLAAHPQFSWDLLIDQNPGAVERARSSWNVKRTASSLDDVHADEIDVIVLATPPNARADYVKAFPGLKAVVVEKPLGMSISAANAFADLCRERNIAVQVNLLRRADTSMRDLAYGGLHSSIGEPQAGVIFYGNGLRNNGTHMVDLARMLVGEVQQVSAFPLPSPFREGPLTEDLNFGAALYLENGICVTMQPLHFANYRENYLDIWGSRGRIAITQEGLKTLQYGLAENRALSGSFELVSESPHAQVTSIGHAFYDLYSNLDEHLTSGAALYSGIESALQTERIVDRCFDSLAENCKTLDC